jgi:CheY-like chemotaxis protein
MSSRWTTASSTGNSSRCCSRPRPTKVKFRPCFWVFFFSLPFFPCGEIPSHHHPPRPRCPVTTVDSGSKALELLGLRDASSPSPSSPDHQVRRGKNPSPSPPLPPSLHLPFPFSRLTNPPLFLLLLQEIDVNLIITDYCMPGMTGYDLLKRVKVSVLKLNYPTPPLLVWALINS